MPKTWNSVNTAYKAISDHKYFKTSLLSSEMIFLGQSYRHFKTRITFTENKIASDPCNERRGKSYIKIHIFGEL